MCGVNSVMTADELDVCGCDSLVSDEAGDSSSVEVVVSVDDVVACDDDRPTVARHGSCWWLIVGGW